MNYDKLLLATLSQDAFFLVNKSLVRKIGGIPAITLSFLIDKYKYYSQENQLDSEKGFYLKSKKEKSNLIESELKIGRTARRSAFTVLEKKKLLKIRKKGHPARYFYYLNHEAILNLISEVDICITSEVETNLTRQVSMHLTSEVETNLTYNKNIKQKQIIKTEKEEEPLLPSQSKFDEFKNYHERKLGYKDDLYQTDLLATKLDYSIELYDKVLEAKNNSEWLPRRNQPNNAKYLLKAFENETLCAKQEFAYVNKSAGGFE